MTSPDTNAAAPAAAKRKRSVTVWAVIGFAGYTEFQPQWSRADARKRARQLFGKVWRIRVERVKP